MNPKSLSLRRLQAALCLSFYLVAARAAAQVTQLDLKAIRTEAVTRFRSGRYDDALGLYRQLVQLQPDNVEAKKELMWALWNAGHFPDAGAVAGDVLKLLPNDAEATNILARAPTASGREEAQGLRQKAVAEVQAGHDNEAIVLYQKLISLDPGNPSPYKDLMWVLWNRERYSEAESTALKIQALRKDDPDAAEVLARMPEVRRRQQLAATRAKLEALNASVKSSLDQNNYAAALPLLHQLVDLDPSVINFNQLISALRKASRYDEGLLAAQQMTAIHKDSSEAWIWQGTFQQEVGDSARALDSFQKGLDLSPHQPRTQLAMGKIYVTLREFDRAIPFLESAMTQDPSLTEVYPLLAKSLYWSAHYERAAVIWAKAYAAYPEHPEYLFQEAQAQFYSGHQAEARATMAHLDSDLKYLPAFDFLVDDAIVQNDVAGAEHKLQTHLVDPLHTDEESRILKLAGLYQESGQKDKLIALLDRYLKIAPDHEPAILMKAGALFEKDQIDDARALYLKVHTLNPYDTEAVRGLAECEQSLGHTALAVSWIEKLAALDPTNPSFLRMRAEYYDWAGDTRKAKALLIDWVNKNQNSSIVPALLYHGLTPSTDDPLLAYPYHMTIATFETQMRALREAEFTPVTANEVTEWIAGKKKLPRHPVMITFDDGRLDSFRYADPILEKYHLKATMFSATVNVEGFHPPGFVSWDRLKMYQQTGRWEIQAHGDIAHIHIPMDAQGNQALFLLPHKWLADQNRLETDAEWKERLRSDYQSSRDKIIQHIGTTPTAYAYPEGLFGQQGHVNSTNVSPVNQRLVKQYFQTAYSQDRYGINLQSRDPGLLNRHEPSQAWKGPQLLNHISDQNPLSLAYQQLLKWSLWEGRTREAYSWLRRMEKTGVSKTVTDARDEEIRFSAGDTAAGQSLAQRAAMMETMPDIEKSIVSALYVEGPLWNPSYTYTDDNEGRHAWEEQQRFETHRRHALKWHVTQRHAEYFDRHVPKVLDNAAGGGIDVNLGLFQNLRLEALGHLFSGSTRNTYSARADLRSELTDNVNTEVALARAPYFTGRALNHNVTSKTVEAIGRLHPEGPWQAIARGRYMALSDQNRRQGGSVEVSRGVIWPTHLRLLYQFSYDNMKYSNADYYSPQHLRLHAFGPEVSFSSRRKTQFTLRYLPAYAQEGGRKSEIDQNVETSLQLRWTDHTFVKSSFAYSRTPTYRENTYGIELQHYF